jgi:hypothetical protein
MNVLVGRLWMVAAVGYFQELSRHLYGGAGETMKNGSQDSRSPGRVSNPGFHTYEAEVLPSQL